MRNTNSWSNWTSDFRIILEDEYNLFKKQDSINKSEAQELLEYRDVFIKFLQKSRLSYQIELSKGTFRGKEEQLYRSMATIDELISWLDWFRDTFKKQIEKENEEKEKRKNK